MAFEEFAFRKVLGLAIYLSLGKVLSAPVRSRAQEAGGGQGREDKGKGVGSRYMGKRGYWTKEQNKS